MLEFIQRGKKRKLIMPLLWLALTALVVAGLLLFVDLKPKVDANFFFSSDDPQFQSDKKINQIFQEPSQIILSVKGPIENPAYQEKIKRLTDQLISLKGVYRVHSLASGPAGLKDAKESP